MQGPIATVLVNRNAQAARHRRGRRTCRRIRAMTDDRSADCKAEPATPSRSSGSSSCRRQRCVQVVEDEKTARALARALRRRAESLATSRRQTRRHLPQIRAARDCRLSPGGCPGSLGAIQNALAVLNDEPTGVRSCRSHGTGAISESDVNLAAASGRDHHPGSTCGLTRQRSARRFLERRYRFTT
jgi:translation initiation factor IF-2